MPILGSVKVSGFVAPTSETDIYPSHDSKYGKGGWREVATLLDRDLITVGRRTEGMAVYVQETDTVYILKDGIDNTNWTLLQTGGGTSTISGATDIELTSLADGEVLKWDAVAGKWINGTIASGDATYNRTEPMAITVGGATVGATFNGTIQDALDKILYPYQAPTFSSFYIDGVPTTYEVGDTFAGGSVTFKWTTTNSTNVKPNSVDCNGVTGLADTGSNVQTIPSVTKTTATVQVYTISALSTIDVAFTKNFNLVWSLKRYWGVSPLTELSDDDIKAMSSEFATNRTKSVTYDCTGGRYFYYAYPTSFGDLNNTKVNGLSWNDWVLVKRNFINSFGIMIPFNIYRSYNLLNGSAVPVVWG